MPKHHKVTMGWGRSSIRRGRRAIAVAAIVVPAIAFTPSSAHAAAPLPGDQTLIIPGAGWGHGRGMGQYGARAQAEDGRTWRQILAHYYSGVAIAQRSTSESIRVNLFTASSTVVGGPESYTAKWSSGATIISSSASYPYMRVRSTSSGIELDKGSSAKGPWTKVTAGSSRVRFYPSGSLMPVYAGGKLTYYRGFIEIVRGSSSGLLYTVNQVRMDHYLYGVVPREMPSSWHGQGLRAQAVAARTYSAYKKDNARTSVYDICGTTACQVYSGYGTRSSHGAAMTVLERSSTNAAVNDTSGSVMTYNGEAIFAEFSSSTGGHTTQGSYAYLAPVPDPWDSISPHHRWVARVTVSEVEAKWPAIGRMTGVSSFVRDGYGYYDGRVSSFKINGTSGSVTVSGNTFRNAFAWPSRPDGVRSAVFAIAIYDAEASGAVAEVLAPPGGSAIARVSMRNTGNRSWPVGKYVTLATSGPRERSSAFQASSWDSGTRVTTVTTNQSDPSDAFVRPGDVAEFRFAVTPDESMVAGVYHERFQLVRDGYTWFGPEVVVPVRVGLAGASHLGSNFVDNASFEGVNGDVPARWNPYYQRTGLVDARAGIDGSTALRFTGERSQRRYVFKRIYRSGEAGESFTLSAWNRTSAVTSRGGYIEVLAVFRSTDRTNQIAVLRYPRNTHGWQYKETAYVTSKPYTKVDIYVSHGYQTGTAWFDRIRLAPNSLPNSGFESGQTAWQIAFGGSGDGVVSRGAYSGLRALQLRGSPSKPVYARAGFAHDGRAGDKVTLSGWHRSVGSDPDNGNVGFRLRVRNTDGTFQWATLEYPRAPHGWGYAETMVTAEKDFDRVDVYADHKRQTGTAWFDEVNVSFSSAIPSLVANAGFELGSPDPGDWSFSGTTTSGVVSTDVNAGARSLRLVGDPERNVYARQPIPFVGRAGDRFVLSGWNQTSGSSASNGVVQVSVVIRHVDGTWKSTVIDFDRAAHDWAYGETIVEATQPFIRIDVYARYQNQVGEARFDRINLRRING